MDIIKLIESKKRIHSYFDDEGVKKKNVYWLEDADLEAIKKQLTLTDDSKSLTMDSRFVVALGK